ncbi:MAG: ribonuclease H-like domain-containing protein [Planctomycetes bacterium]|nr:ribonuclease H-like domain-containing protein [Planctomycetota bacterium]
MLTSSFVFAKGMTEEMERTVWAHGITSWDLLRRHPDEVAEVIGAGRCQRLLEAVNDAQQALLTKDLAWFRTNWPERELWRLWQGYCEPARVALVDIETTGLTPGYDQITVIGLADNASARVFVAGRPQPGDETLEKFRDAIRGYQLLVTFNGTSFDVPFIEKQFRDTSFHFEPPHFDLLPSARSLGLGGGLKDMERQLGIVRAADIKDMRGTEAIQLWGAWKNGDAAAYKRLTTYCKADCVNLKEFADHIYRRKWEKTYTPFARTIDFDGIKGQQLTLF